MSLINKALSAVLAVLAGATVITPASVQAVPGAPTKSTQPVCSVGHSCNAGVCISLPKQNACVPGPDVTVKFCTWNLRTVPGAESLHIMLDDEPFDVHYDQTKAHVFKNVAPGTHTIRLYACDALHRAIGNAFDTVTFHVQYPDDRNTPEANYPMLTYNLPQGEYMGLDTQNILLDFFVTPAPKGSNRATHVEYWVDGRRFMGDPSKTQALPTLSPGYHNIKVQLVDVNGKRVPGAFNSVERTILVSPDKSPRIASDRPGYIQSIPGPVTGGKYWVAKELKDRETHEKVQNAAAASETGVNQTLANRIMGRNNQPQANTASGQNSDFSFRTDRMDGTQIRKVAKAASSDNSTTASSPSADTGDDGTIDRLRNRMSRGTAPVRNRETSETVVKVTAPEPKKSDTTTTTAEGKQDTDKKKAEVPPAAPTPQPAAQDAKTTETK